jgi:hypothetical protein
MNHLKKILFTIFVLVLSLTPLNFYVSAQIDNQNININSSGVYYLSKMSADGNGGSLNVLVNGTSVLVVKDYNQLSENLSLGMLKASDSIEVVIKPFCDCRAKEYISSTDKNLALLSTLKNTWQIAFEDAQDNDFNDLIVEIGLTKTVVNDNQSSSSSNSSSSSSSSAKSESSSSSSSSTPDKKEEIITKQDKKYIVPQPKYSNENVSKSQLASLEVCNGFKLTYPKAIDKVSFNGSFRPENTYFNEQEDAEEYRAVPSKSFLVSDQEYRHGFFAFGCVNPVDYAGWQYAYVENYTISPEELYKLTGWEFAKEVKNIRNTPRSRGNFQSAEYMIVFEYKEKWYYTYFNSRDYAGNTSILARDVQLTVG